MCSIGKAWDDAYHHPDHGPKLEANTRITVALGKSVTALEALSCERLRRWAFELVTEELFKKLKLDAIASPTLPFAEPPAITKGAKAAGESNVPLTIEMMKFIFTANFLGLPAVTLPVPRAASSAAASVHPVALQFTGDHWAEAKLLRLAREVEAREGKAGEHSCSGVAARPADYFDALAAPPKV